MYKVEILVANRFEEIMGKYNWCKGPVVNQVVLATLKKAIKNVILENNFSNDCVYHTKVKNIHKYTFYCNSKDSGERCCIDELVIELDQYFTDNALKCQIRYKDLDEKTNLAE